jgi:uroporphyrinogen III methyltransferase/synthase
MISVLLSPAEQKSELAIALERNGTRIFTWPRLKVAPAENQTALDEAIANLFGYDWLILKCGTAADFFLKRLEELGHEKSALDGLRVCVIGEETASRIRESEIHVDIEVSCANSGQLFPAIESYVGGRDSLAGLNFLLPSGKVIGDVFQTELGDAGARIDSVAAYRTTPDPTALAQLNALLVGDGIDGVFFRSASEVGELAQLLDTYDLGRILPARGVICGSQSAQNLALEFGLGQAALAEAATTNATTSLIAATLESK